MFYSDIRYGDIIKDVLDAGDIANTFVDAEDRSLAINTSLGFDMLMNGQVGHNMTGTYIADGFSNGRPKYRLQQIAVHPYYTYGDPPVGVSTGSTQGYIEYFPDDDNWKGWLDGYPPPDMWHIASTDGPYNPWDAHWQGGGRWTSPNLSDYATFANLTS
jgi:hypothetical protein